MGGQDDSGAFSEPDALESIALAPAAEDDFVAVLEEPALLAVRQLQRLGSPPRQLEQAPPLVFLRPGNRAAAEQVAGAQVAAIAGVMGDELRRRPVHPGQ